MSKFISTALFASLVGKAVSEDVTATAWLPGMQDSGITYVGSVVSASGDTSVMVLDYTNLPSSLSDLVSNNTYPVIATESNINSSPLRVIRRSLWEAQLFWITKPRSLSPAL
jgi:hypothetical protein